MADREAKDEYVLKKYFDVVQILKSLGHPLDIAKAMLFLSCDDPRFVTGEILNIEGGLPFKL